jgi:hypothetical protein
LTLTPKEIRAILLKGDNPILNAVWQNTTDDQLMCILDSEGTPNAEGWGQTALVATDTVINVIPVVGDLYSIGTGWVGYNITGKMNCVEKWLSSSFGAAGITITVVGAVVTWYTGGTVGGAAGSITVDAAKYSFKSILTGGGKAFVKDIVKKSAKYMAKSIGLSLGLVALGGAIGFVVDQTGLLSVDTSKLEGLTEEEVEILKNGENSVKPLATTATIIVGGAVVRAVRSQMWVSSAGIKLKLATKTVSKFAHLDKLLTVGNSKLGEIYSKNSDIIAQKDFWHTVMGAKNSGDGAGGGHMITALINKTVRVDKLFDASGNEILAGATQDQYLSYMKANPTDAIKTNISVKDMVNGVETWTKKGRYDSNGNFLNYITHTFTPAGWSETKFMEEMRNARNQVSDAILDNPIRTQNTIFNNNVKLLNVNTIANTKAYEITASFGFKYTLVISMDTRKIKTFYINK